jgi:hypothetical protein
VEQLVDHDIRRHRDEIDRRPALEQRGRQRRERRRARVLGERAVRPDPARLDAVRVGIAREIDRAPRQRVAAGTARVQPRRGRPAALVELEDHGVPFGVQSAGAGERDATLPHAGRPFRSVRGWLADMPGVGCGAGCGVGSTCFGAGAGAGCGC